MRHPPPHDDRGERGPRPGPPEEIIVNSTIVYAVAAEHRHDLLRRAADHHRALEVLGGAPAHGPGRVPRYRVPWWRRAMVRSVHP